MRQNILFSIKDFLDVKPLQNFRLLFDNLKHIQLTHVKQTGRKPILRESILNALIFKSLKSIPTLTQLYRDIADNPGAALCCGFDIRKPITSVECFSAFLNDTPNKELTQIRNLLVHRLIELNEFNFNIEAVMADRIYDTAAILKYIINTLHAKPRISINPRNTPQAAEEKEIKYTKAGNRICDANLEMLSRGVFYDKKQDRWLHKWICPLHHSKKYQYQFIVCPVYHPKFFSQKGCYAYKRVDDDIRKQIDYGSESFKTDANLRTGSERLFSRLLTICMQKPSVVGLKATTNHCTIAHITVLLVALTAVKNNFKDQLRFIKSFLPNFAP